MRSFSLFTDPTMILNLVKNDNVVYIDSIPYKGVDLNKNLSMKQINKIEVKTLKRLKKK